MSDKSVYYLDTETTGLGMDDQVIQIGILDQSGQVVLSRLLDTDHSIHPKAQEVHGISKQTLVGAPRWPEIHDQVASLLADSSVQIKAYNALFDLRMILQTAQAYGLVLPVLQGHCVMREFADRYNDGTWVNLSLACGILDVEISDLEAHDALADAEMTRRLDLKMREIE